MSAELQKLAKQLDLKGFEIASGEVRDLNINLIKRGLIPESLNGQSTEIFPGEDIGKIVKSYRMERKLSQRKLAHLSGISHSLLSRLEARKTTPNLSTVFKISHGLELNHQQEDDLLHVARTSVLKP